MTIIIGFFEYFSLVLRRPKSAARKYNVHRGSDKSLSFSSGGWKFDRDSPYTGSPFFGIDGIPGFDEDGLPSEIIN